MRDKLIEILRSVPITDKTYSEYIEAVAYELMKEIYFPPSMRFEAKAIPATINVKYRDEIPESEMGMSGYSKFAWKLWEEGICDMQKAQRADQIMREQGYRKASEVAKEIFAEITKMLICNHVESYKTVLNDTWLYRFKKSLFIELDELKKKYTEERK